MASEKVPVAQRHGLMTSAFPNPYLPQPLVTPRRSRLETFPETAPEATQTSSLSQPEGVDMAVKKTWLYLILS